MMSRTLPLNCFLMILKCSELSSTPVSSITNYIYDNYVPAKFGFPSITNTGLHTKQFIDKISELYKSLAHIIPPHISLPS